MSKENYKLAGELQDAYFHYDLSDECESALDDAVVDLVIDTANTIASAINNLNHQNRFTWLLDRGVSEGEIRSLLEGITAQYGDEDDDEWDDPWGEE